MASLRSDIHKFCIKRPMGSRKLHKSLPKLLPTRNRHFRMPGNVEILFLCYGLSIMHRWSLWNNVGIVWLFSGMCNWMCNLFSIRCGSNLPFYQSICVNSPTLDQNCSFDFRLLPALLLFSIVLMLLLWLSISLFFLFLCLDIQLVIQ